MSITFDEVYEGNTVFESLEPLDNASHIINTLYFEFTFEDEEKKTKRLVILLI